MGIKRYGAEEIIRKLKQADVLISQVNQHFFGCHVPTVFGSGLVGKPMP